MEKNSEKNLKKNSEKNMEKNSEKNMEKNSEIFLIIYYLFLSLYHIPKWVIEELYYKKVHMKKYDHL